MLNHTFVFYYSNIELGSFKRSLALRNKCERLNLAYVGHGDLETIIKYGGGYFRAGKNNCVTVRIIVVMDKVETIAGFEDFELISYEDFITP